MLRDVVIIFLRKLKGRNMKNILIVIVVLCAFGLILFWFFSEKNADDSKEGKKILKKM